MRDQYDFIVDQYGDGGDSCNFTCALAFFNEESQVLRASAFNLSFYNLKLYAPLQLVRHPLQLPWNNPKNFTVDQAVPWVACASPDLVRRFYKQYPFFMPNTERDWPGSRKMKRPHEFFKDSHIWMVTAKPEIDTTTLPLRLNLKTFKWEGRLTSNFGHTIERRMFDCADFIQPSFRGMMIIKGKFWPHYPLLPICYLWCVGSILAHCLIYAKDPTNNDFKQLFIMSTFYKLEKLFCRLHPRGLVQASHKYFIEARNLPEIHLAFVNYLKRRGLYEIANEKNTLLGT